MAEVGMNTNSHGDDMKTEADKRFEEEAELEEAKQRNEPKKRISAVQIEDQEQPERRLLRL